MDFHKILEAALYPLITLFATALGTGIIVFIKNLLKKPKKIKLHDFQVERLSQIVFSHEIYNLIAYMREADGITQDDFSIDISEEIHIAKRKMILVFIRIYGYEICERLEDLMRDGFKYNGSSFFMPDTFRAFFNDVLLSVTDKAITKGTPLRFINKFFMHYNRTFQNFIDKSIETLNDSKEYDKNDYEEKLKTILVSYDVHLRFDLIEFLKRTAQEMNGELLKELLNGR